MKSAPTLSASPESSGSGEVLAGLGEQAEKISEVVGENANENGGNSDGKKMVQKKDDSKKDDSKINFKPKKKVLPPPNQQKVELKKAIEKKTQKLISEAMKLQNQKDFEAAKLEQVIVEIRYLRRVLAEIVSATVERVADLYRKFVWKK